MPKQFLNQPGLAVDELKAQSLSISTIVRLRWIAIIGQIVAIGIVSMILEFKLPLGYCLAAIAMSAWLNVYLAIAFSSTLRIGNVFATMMLAFDILQLTILLYLTGGIQNPFTMLIVVPVTVSAAALPLRNTLFLGLLSIAATAALVYNHWPLPWYDGIHFDIPFLYKAGIFFAVSASMVFIGLYAWRLASESRRMFAAKVAAELVLAREQKLHALDGLAAAAAHELGTPLSTIFLVTKELASDSSLPSEHADDIKLLREQAKRCQEILRKLTRKPGEQDDPVHSQLGVRALLDEAAAPYIDVGKRISIDSRASDSDAEPSQPEASQPEPMGVRQPGMIYGLGNLIENAVNHAQSEVNITARWDPHDVVVEISDDGPGFSQDVMDSLGNPYVTTHLVGNATTNAGKGGLGLGFFIAKTLLERSGASFTFDNKRGPETGAVVLVTWPYDAFTKCAG